MHLLTSLLAGVMLMTQVSTTGYYNATLAEKGTETVNIFVGDSRTVGLKSAMSSSDNENDIYIAKVGEGYSWFTKTAAPELEKAISQNKGKDINVIINFGVNDLANVDKYAAYVNNLDNDKDDNVTFYYESVNPVKNYPTVNNSQISGFNEKLEEGLNDDVVWIDTYSLMQENGFKSPDGLHYSKETYEQIYEYVTERL